MFSPWYARRRRQGPADPYDHCALNIVLHGPGGKRWAMTERGRASTRHESHRLTIGPSSVECDATSLQFRIDEKASPFPFPIRGDVCVTPSRCFDTQFPLDSAHRHRWLPWAPRARIDVNLDAPKMRWSGFAYCDANEGDEALERGIESWHWLHGRHGDDAVIVYDVLDRRAKRTTLALRFADDIRILPIDQPLLRALPTSKWGLPRAAYSEGNASVARTLDDTPFYVRSVVNATLCGRPLECVHESLSLNRFAAPIVQAMLPFRMRRNLRQRGI